MQLIKLLKKCLFPRRHVVEKFLFMKLTAVLFLLINLQLHATTYAQVVTLDCQQVPLKKIFKEIIKQTGVAIIYKESQLDEFPKVSIHVKNMPIRDALSICFKDLPYQFKVVGNSIIISKPVDDNASSGAFRVKITGVVLSSDHQPLPGATVSLKGTKTGTTANAEGKFSLEVARANGVLVVSFIGYLSKEINFSAATELQIILSPDDNKMKEVVVTALGVTRSNKSLSYNIQQITSSDVNTIKQTNVVNSLSGKVAGLTISQSASGVGGSAKVILRGSRSVNGSNQPLYVIDGVPMLNEGNANGQISGFYGGGFSEGGDGISNLNPEDIASISVLEGASAAALYGSQAQNGVILITTKKGRQGKAEINFSSSYQNSQIAYKPDFQNKYGATAGQANGDISSWGGNTTKTYDNLKAYFSNGSNFTNAISLSAGNAIAKTYFSYANTTASGVQPDNKLSRHNLNFRETGNFLNNKLTLDGSVNYIYQDIQNSPFLGAFPNPILSLYLFPRGMDISPYKANYFRPDSVGAKRQNWSSQGAGDFHQENPWWMAYKEPNSNKRNRYLINVSAKYDFADWLNLQIRGNMDQSTDIYERRLFQGTNGSYDIGGTGTYKYGAITRTQKYADAIANFKIPLHSKDIQLGGLVGASINDVSNAGISGTGALLTPDYFTISNIVAKNAAQVTTGGSVAAVLNPMIPVAPNHQQLQAVFGNIDISFKDWLFLNFTARNDWSSSLAYTNSNHYFYPSAGISFLLSEAVKLPAFISYAKLRGSVAEVGSTIPVYLTFLQNSQNTSGQLVFTTNEAPSTLKPERTKSFEAGTDLRFLNNRLNISFTYYKSNTLNQYFPYNPSPTSLVTTAYINAGNVQNTGYEFTLGLDVINRKDFTWNTTLNGSANKNKILEVRDTSSNPFIITNDGNGYQSVIRKGGSYGDIYGFDFVRDAQGRIVVNGDGTPAKPYKPSKSGFQYVGNPNPKFQLGWSNSFRYKHFNFYFLVDGKFGGKVMSITQSYMDFMGVSAATGAARDNGGVTIDGVTTGGKAVTSMDPKVWYTTIGARGAMTGAYMYDATVVRLREVALGYSWTLPDKVVKNLGLTLTGRNLLYFYKKAPYDPEITMSTGNGTAGIDVFNQPATRDIGLNLKVTF
jgi:TonB-linked SusC/RagA family outer membrane protein